MAQPNSFVFILDEFSSQKLLQRKVTWLQPWRMRCSLAAIVGATWKKGRQTSGPSSYANSIFCSLLARLNSFFCLSFLLSPFFFFPLNCRWASVYTLFCTQWPPQLGSCGMNAFFIFLPLVVWIALVYFSRKTFVMFYY